MKDLCQFKRIIGLSENEIVLAFTVKAEAASICGIAYQLRARPRLWPLIGGQ
jgi:hypothetical protein